MLGVALAATQKTRDLPHDRSLVMDVYGVVISSTSIAVCNKSYYFLWLLKRV
jgi:hypothetical protein